MVKKISTSVQDVFIPTWEGNSELPVNEQIRVKHKAPTIAMKERLFPREFNLTQEAQGKDFTTSMSIRVDRKKVIAEMTLSIDNCAYETPDGAIKKITTVEQLMDAPADLDTLVEEIYTYYQNLLTGKVDEKN